MNQVAVAEIRKRKINGESYREIAKSFGVSKQRIHQLIAIPGPAPSGKCEQCHKHVQKLHRHHTDYSTDTFILLCNACHIKTHANLRFQAGNPPQPQPEPPIECPHCNGTGVIEDQRHLGAHFRRLRIEANLSVTEVARRMQLSPTAVTNLEAGKWFWSTKRIESFKQAVGKSPTKP